MLHARAEAEHIVGFLYVPYIAYITARHHVLHSVMVLIYVKNAKHWAKTTEL